MKQTNRYVQIIERVFTEHYRSGASRVEFLRSDLERIAGELRIALPKNLGDLIYTFRYRVNLPESVASKAPRGTHWIILPAGRARYRFEATTVSTIVPNDALVETKILDATPGMVSRYRLSDEQALLATLRYNRLIDVFTGVTCYSLQNHLRTTVPDLGQVETDEIYVGLDKRGAHYVFPVQAKGGRDRINIVQIIQDFALCKAKFPSLLCRPIAAQFMADDVIALFEFEESKKGFGIQAEKHYRLSQSQQVSDVELTGYAKRGNEGTL